MSPTGKVRNAIREWLDRVSAKQATGPGTARATEGWQSLREPIPGHSTIDGVPVPVVAVRRNALADTLEVVRGFGPNADDTSAATARGLRRHVVPALSFIPHPRRRLIIDHQQFFFGSVPNKSRCEMCGGEYHGFGFVNSGAPVEGGDASTAEHSSLCETCAAKCAEVTA